MGRLWQDLKFGARTLFRDRVFLFTAVLALALGIGSTTAIFSVIDNVLLEPFPYTDGQLLVAVAIHDTSRPDPDGRQGYAQPEFVDYQEQNTVFSGVIGVSQQQAIWTDKGHIEAFRAASVTGNTFEFLGVAPLIGRSAAPHDAEPGAPPVFVLSYKVWQKRFAGDPNILGRTFTLDGIPRTLIGIMPKRFAWWGADLWIPKSPNRAETGQSEAFMNLLGRLKPGESSKRAALALNVLAHRLAKTYPKYYPDKFDVQLPAIIDNVVGQFRSTLYTLLAAVGFLLLIACANVANLLLAKATAREKEFAIRASLGAGSWRVIGQLLVESLMLALLSAAAGCAFAYACLKGLVALLPAFTFPDEADISLNLRVLAATRRRFRADGPYFRARAGRQRPDPQSERIVEGGRPRKQRIPQGLGTQRSDRGRGRAVAGPAYWRRPADAQFPVDAERRPRVECPAPGGQPDQPRSEELQIGRQANAVST